MTLNELVDVILAAAEGLEVVVFGLILIFRLVVVLLLIRVLTSGTSENTVALVYVVLRPSTILIILAYDYFGA